MSKANDDKMDALFDRLADVIPDKSEGYTNAEISLALARMLGCSLYAVADHNQAEVHLLVNDEILDTMIWLRKEDARRHARARRKRTKAVPAKDRNPPVRAQRGVVRGPSRWWKNRGGADRDQRND